ncbi:6030_t:CDS:1, partial [Racocetra fulgida]
SIHDKINNWINSNEIKQQFEKLEKLKEIQIKSNTEWIPFNRLTNIIIIRKDGFITVYKAT